MTCILISIKIRIIFLRNINTMRKTLQDKIRRFKMLFGRQLLSIMAFILTSKFNSSPFGYNLNIFLKLKDSFDILVMIINRSNFIFQIKKSRDAANIAVFLNFGTIFDSIVKHKTSTL